MPSLDVYQSLWAMELRRPDGVERSHEEAFEMTAAAGYAGMALDLGAPTWPPPKPRRTCLGRTT